MASLEQEIEAVREQLDRQVSLKSRLERMKAQQAKLNWEVGLRKERWHQEEQDIDQLEAFSWERLLQQKAEHLKQRQPDKAAVIFQLEARQRECRRQLKELREAADAGKVARGLARRLVEKMDDALTWSTVDLFGGGMMTGFVKHSRLEEAQQLAQQLEDQLRCFESELTDVDIHTSLELTVDPFLRILDLLFDNFITDWAVQERIEKALAQAKTAEDEVQALLDHLAARQDQTQREKAELDRQRRLLIEQTSI